MYKICKTEESARRQRMLEEMLLQAMTSKPYNKITISSLCQENGIPRKAFYRYFPTLDDALLALIDHTLDRSNSSAITVWDGSDRFSSEPLERFFSYWQTQKSFLQALTANNLWPLLIERTTVFVNRQKTGSEDPAVSEDYEKDLPEYFVASGLMFTILRWYSDGFPSSPRKMAQATADLLSSPTISLSKLLL